MGVVDPKTAMTPSVLEIALDLLQLAEVIGASRVGAIPCCGYETFVLTDNIAPSSAEKMLERLARGAALARQFETRDALLSSSAVGCS
jgi:hypothetical protein